jgi:DNA-binding Lrp family transcriptional regulator
MALEFSEVETRIINAIKKLGRNAFTRKIAAEAKVSFPTASKYLSVLEGRGVIKRDVSRLPYVFWEIIKEDAK